MFVGASSLHWKQPSCNQHLASSPEYAFTGVIENGSSDDDWPYGDFCREMKKRKRAAREQQVQTQEDRLKESRRQPEEYRADEIHEWKQKALELDSLKGPRCNDWLLHSGNASYARDRASFREYYALSQHITARVGGGEGAKRVTILGIDNVRMPWKRQLGQPHSRTEIIGPVLHIPSARCNGLSIPRLEEMGEEVRVRDDDRFTCFNEENEPRFCGTRTSGKLRIYMRGEDDDEDEARHITLDLPISIWADRTQLTRLCPEFGITP